MKSPTTKLPPPCRPNGETRSQRTLTLPDVLLDNVTDLRAPRGGWLSVRPARQTLGKRASANHWGQGFLRFGTATVMRTELLALPVAEELSTPLRRLSLHFRCMTPSWYREHVASSPERCVFTRDNLKRPFH